MRKSLLFGAMLLIASCTVQKEEEFESPLLHRYHAVMEEPVDAETRVYADSKLRVHWNEGDHISIFERKTYNQEYEFLGDNGDTAGDFDPVESSGYHTGGDIEDGHVYAIYPYDKKNKCDYEGKLTVTFPSAQHYKKDSFGIGANIMVARTNTMDLNFMHLGGYRTFKLYGEGVSVSSIRIESNGPEFLSGRTDVIIGSDGKPAVSFIESETNSKAVELVCDTPVALGSSASEAVEFWFVLPPCTLTQGFTVMITDNNGGVFTKATSNSIEIKSGVKKSMSAFEVVPVIAVSGVELDQTEATITVGNTATLTATVLPENATNKEVSWSSSDEAVATVDENGSVIAVGTGTATITVTTEDGDKTASCMVTVTPVKVSSVTISPTSANVSVGSTVTLTPTVTPSNAADKSVTWSSSDTDVATVNSSGVVSGITAGTATITATAKDGSGVSGSCTVIVNNVPVSSVELNKTSLSLINGTSEKLIATVNPDNATNKTITWTSSNTSVATVGSDGTVLAKSVGTATITATADGKSATCTVTVTPIMVSSVTLSPASASVNVGSTVTITPTVTPSNAADKSIVWSTSDATVATVSYGVVTGVKAGTVTITATAHDGSGIKATCTVTVKNVDVTSITLDKTVLIFNSLNETQKLHVTVMPDNATFPTVTWLSSNTSVATVQSDGTVTSIGPGRTSITATAGSLTATCAVSVTITIPVTGVSLSGLNSYRMPGNYTLNKDAVGYMYEKIIPSDATNKNVTWRSSDTSVATIDSKGKITAHSSGQTTITVTTVDGNKSATCVITVYNIDAVDLGLPSGLKWGSMNLGAASPSDYGDYYAWGEITTKTYFYEDDYTVKDRYCYSSNMGEIERVLNGYNDAASTLLDGGTGYAPWRIPTKEQIEELTTTCTWTWTTSNGKNGYLVTGPNGNSIFLPAAGLCTGEPQHRGVGGSYWSATVCDTGYKWTYAWELGFDQSHVNSNYKTPRYYGLSIRPVRQ